MRIKRNPIAEQMKPFMGVYVVDLNRALHERRNDIVTTAGPKFVFVACEVSAAYTSQLIQDPPLK